MNFGRIIFSFFLLAVVGLQASVVSRSHLSRKTPGAPRSKDGHTLGLYDGKTTTIKKHPYMAAVLYLGEFLCAATIISDSWVLLSADCVYGMEEDYMSVVVASENAGVSGRTYTVEDVEVHPDYGENYLDYNYGLLRINGRFRWSKTVRRAKLPRREAKAGSEAVIVGWGETERLTEMELGSEEKLREGHMEFLSRKDCETIYAAQKLTFTERMGCSYDKGKVTPCDGDWSDPLVEGDTVYQLVIAVGTTGECSGSAYPAINADVRAAHAWITNTTGLFDDDDDDRDD